MNIDFNSPFTCFGEDIPEPGFTKVPSDNTSVYIPPVGPSGNVIGNGNEPLNNQVIQTVSEEQPKRHILKTVLGLTAAYTLYSILT